jgi:sulfonate transport system substrate-binding protein
MHLLKSWLVLAVFTAGYAASAEKPAPALQLHGFIESLEIAPVLLAADRHYPAGVSLKRGGIANLVGLVTTGYGDPGIADVATNAETQLLRHSVAHPELRVIMTVTEGRYRIVARRSAGIHTLSDLKGKRVGTMANTSAAYFLERMLKSARLKPADIVAVTDIALPDLSAALVNGKIDALAFWSPDSEKAELALGKDAVVFNGDDTYREIFNLNTTAQALADPTKRAAIKQLVKALIVARDAMARDPLPAQRLVARNSGYSPALVAASWPHQRYLVGKVSDLLEVMVEEEKWLARIENRSLRNPETLANLIDYSLLDEVMAEDVNGH